MTTSINLTPLNPSHSDPTLSSPTPDTNSNADTTPGPTPANVANVITLSPVLTFCIIMICYLAGSIPLCKLISWMGVAVMSGLMLCLVKKVGGGWWAFSGFLFAFLVHVAFKLGHGTRIAGLPPC